jgi:lantibiotic modifying enzyme
VTPGVEVALLVAERLQTVDRVASAVRETSASNPPAGWVWQDHATASGFAGLAVLFGCLARCRPDEGWDRAAHEHLMASVEAAKRARSLPLGLATGLGGLAFTALLLAGDGHRYVRLRQALDEKMGPGVSMLAGRLRDDRQPACQDVDVISGAAGVLSYLLARPERDRLAKLRSDLLAAAAGCVIEYRLPRRPGAGVDLGLAHGVAGLVAALAVAHRQGVGGPAVAEGLRTGASWLLARRSADQWGATWAREDPPARAAGATHAAWCYGAPGVARSLLLAGAALGDPALTEAALAAFEGVCRRPDHERHLVSPTFCHGHAGLAHLLHQTAVETGRGELRAEAHRLLNLVAAGFDSSTAFGYRAGHRGGSAVDSPGLLDGAAGVALVLLSAASAGLPAWDRLFLVQ